MMKKILVVGAYGCGNKGDDAILEGFLETLGRKFELIPTCGNYGGIEQLFQKKVDYISCRMNEGFSGAVFFNLLKFFPNYIKKLSTAEAVIIGGGSLLHDITKYNLPFFFLLQKIAKRKRKKVIYAGVGAGPICTEKGKTQVRNYLNASDGVWIRDPADYELLKDMGVKNVKLSADMAFGVETDYHVADKVFSAIGVKRGEYVVVTACQWFKSDNFWKRGKMDFSSDRAKLVGAIQRLLECCGKKVIFLPTVFHDYELGKQLKEEIKSEDFIVLHHRYDCKTMASIVANSSFLFGTRMHSMIFAIRSGVPFLATIYDEKVRHLIERVGMNEYTIEFDRIDSSEFEQLIEKILVNREMVGKILTEKAKELREIVWNDVGDITKIIS